MNAPANWNQLKSRCAKSACNTANGGCTIILRGDFLMGSYTGEIDFSGKTITIWGQEKVLDASLGGRFFYGQGGGLLLELHDVVLQNGQVSGDGGALLLGNANVEIHTSSFISNEATQGGAITIDDGDLKIYNTTFQSNAAVTGAIYASGTDVKIYTSIFESNSAGNVCSSKAVLKQNLTFLLKLPAGNMARFRMTNAPLILLVLSQLLAQRLQKQLNLLLQGV
jgi:hypothetical protein